MVKSKTSSFWKLSPVRISDATVLGLVDIVNSFYNAMPLSVVTRIGLTDFKPY